MKHLRDRVRNEVTEHKELVAQVSEERLQAEKDVSELDAQILDYQKMLKVASCSYVTTAVDGLYA